MKKPAIANEFLNGLSILWHCLFIKDPCKKCIIRACCKKEMYCEAKRESLYYQYPYNSIIAPKLYSWAIFIIIVLWSIMGILFILKKLFGPVAQW